MLTLQANDFGDSAFFGMALGLVACVYAVMFALGIVILIAQWKVYTKAGQPGWAVFIPIYNILVMLDIIRKPRIWLGYMIGAVLLQSIFTIIIAALTSDNGNTNVILSGLMILTGLAVNVFTAVMSIRIVHGLSLAFGQSAAFTVGLIFLPFIFIPILAFGDAQYQYANQTNFI